MSNMKYRIIAIGVLASGVFANCWVNGDWVTCGTPGITWCPKPGGQPTPCYDTQTPAGGCTIRNVVPAPLNASGRTLFDTGNCAVTRTSYTCPTQPGGDCVAQTPVVVNCPWTEACATCGVPCIGVVVEDGD